MLIGSAQNGRAPTHTAGYVGSIDGQNDNKAESVVFDSDVQHLEWLEPARDICVCVLETSLLLYVLAL
jgi:hypothetical protein